MLAIPLVAAAAAGAWQYVYWSSLARELDYSRLAEMESASLVLDRNGELIGRIYIQNRDQKPLSAISKNLQRAVISSEDSRFFKHHGVDYTGILRALTHYVRTGRKNQGASTLTQQVARNTFPKELPPEEKSMRRKVLEMFVAFEIEKRKSKEEILELYLNRVYFGSGFYGAEAAARGYFGKAASQLTVTESAMLAGLLPQPTPLSPWKNRQANTEARNHVLGRMREVGFLKEEEYRKALADHPQVKNPSATTQENYTVGMVAAQLPTLGLSDAVSEGYRIHTTVDLNLQRKAEEVLEHQIRLIERRPDFKPVQTLETYDSLHKTWKKAVEKAGPDAAPPPLEAPRYLQGAALVLDNQTGAIRAMIGGRNPRHSEFNLAIQGKRPAGGVFKPFVYAAAYERGLHPFFPVDDFAMNNREAGGPDGMLGEWSSEVPNPKWEGLIEARKALSRSKNAATVRLGSQIGSGLRDSLDAVTSLCRAAGIKSHLNPDPRSFLGSSDMSLAELVLAYSSFPGGGSRPAEPYLIERIEDNTGQILYQAAPKRAPVMTATTAFQVHESLVSVLNEGTGSAAYQSLGLRRAPFAGKTGSTNNFADAWFVGYSSSVTCGVWVGYDKTREIYPLAYSSETALPVWVEIMNATLAAHPAAAFKRPADWVPCKICTKSGYAPLPVCVEVSADNQTTPTTSDVLLAPHQHPGPADTCDFHGPKRPRRSRTDGETPVKVDAVVDLSKFEPIALQSPTVLGKDPFHSEQAERWERTIKNSQVGQGAPVNTELKDAQPPANSPAKDEPVEVPVKVKPVTAPPAQPVPEQTPRKPSLPKLEF